MKPVWFRYDRKKREESLLGFWILLGATLIAILGTIFWNIVCLLFVIVFAIFAAIFLQGFARPRVEILLDECKRARASEEEFFVEMRAMAPYFLMLSSPHYLIWQICSLLLLLGTFWSNPVNLWFVTTFPALLISTFILIPQREKWNDLGGSSKHFWWMQILVYLVTLAVAALVLLVLYLVLGTEFFSGAARF